MLLRILQENIQKKADKDYLLAILQTLIQPFQRVDKRDHPYITSVHFWTFSDPPYVSINSTECQQKLPFFCPHQGDYLPVRT